MEFGWLFALSCLAAIGEIVCGLKCYECFGARSNLECILRGRVRMCNPSQKSCQNTLRVSNGQFRIYKGCKQTHACNNDAEQSSLRKHALKSWKSVQCKIQFRSTVCSCCCALDKCNDKAMYCRQKPISPPKKRTRSRYQASPRRPLLQDDAPKKKVVVPEEDKSACGSSLPYCSGKGKCKQSTRDGTWKCFCQRGNGGKLCNVSRPPKVVACWSRSGEC